MKIDTGTPLDGGVIEPIMHAVVCSRNLSRALDPFEGSPKALFKAYLAAGLHKDSDAPSGLKSITRMSSELGGVAGRTTLGRWLREIDPDLARRVIAAHPQVGHND